MSTERFAVPGWLVEDARRFAESAAPPATPRVAATVLLLRGSAAGLEVYVQQRAATMAFAPGLYAFPGGSVDTRDRDVDVAWGGHPPPWWAQRLSLPEPQARAVVCAAVREVFEECGVQLAGPDESTVVGDVSADEWEQARVALLDRRVGFAELLATRGLTLRSDLLEPWARWLTPEFEPRRYDTYFFLARLPVGQRPRDVGGESVRTRWLRPSEAASLPMLPPTALTLAQVGAYSDIDEALAAAVGRDVRSPVMPRIEVTEDGGWLLI
jgi:8-oxo-dGTP pyrophosphatase MutT (NUDIX family)